MRVASFVLVFAALLAATPSSAHADLVVAGPSSGSSSSSSGTASRTEFYGWINMLVGELGLGAAVGVAALSSLGSSGGGSDAGGAAGLGGAAYLFGGPIVHAVKGDFTKSLGAFGLLVGMPLTGGLIGYGASSGCASNDCRVEAAVWGGVAGAALAPIVDGLALGWKAGRSEHAELPPVMPYAVPVAGGVTVGVVGAF